MQIFNEKGNMAKLLPSYLSEWTTTKVQAEGVKVLPNVELIGAELNNDKKLTLSLKDGQKINADHVIVAVGVEANTQLAKSSELEVDPELGGFLVNAELEARSNLFVVSIIQKLESSCALKSQFCDSIKVSRYLPSFE